MFIEQGHFIDTFDQAHLAYLYVNELSCPLVVLELAFLCSKAIERDPSVSFVSCVKKLVCFSSIASDILPCLHFVS